MKNSRLFQRAVLLFMLLMPAIMLVTMSSKVQPGGVDRFASTAPAQEALRYVAPAEPARASQSSGLAATLSDVEGTGGYRAGSALPAANALTIDQAEAAGLLEATADSPDGETDISPPASEDCIKCPDRPRRTRTPGPNQNDPTQTPVVVPTDTPVVLPTNTPVVLPTNTAPPPATWTPRPATATPIANYHNPPPAVVSAEAQMYQLINAHRASIGLNQWTRVTALDLAERDWALQMAVTDQCYHGDYGQRAMAQGYSGFAWGEVGACGYPTAQEAFQGWLDSPGHRGIIEAGNAMTDVGIGAWQYPNGYFTFWALVGQH